MKIIPGCARSAFRYFVSILLASCTVIGSRPVMAQSSGKVVGTVSTIGQTMPGVHVFIEGTTIGAITDENGEFELVRVPAGSHRIVARFVGYETVILPIEVSDDVLRVDISMREVTTRLDEIVVSAIGERQSRSEIPATIQSIDREALESVRPSHPSEVMSRIPGVWVNTTSGEGHMTAIRQPLTTDPVYLFLENGVPVRSTGFFNHNALYELNVPMAASIEVLKGPGTALYGSDAVGGVINVTTQRAPEEPMANLSVEGGSAGFGRIMLGTGMTTGSHGLRLDLNATKGDGWREATQYDRQSGTLTWNADLGNAAHLRTIASYTAVDQKPAGSSALSRVDFQQDPTLNYAPISYREVRALRISSAYERTTSRSVLGITPYFRYNVMSILPNWSLAYDPSVWTTENTSIGMQLRMRQDLDPLRLIGGIDLESSPGSHHERIIVPVLDGRTYTAYQEGEAIYEYDVAFRQASPYVHVEYVLAEGLRFSGGLRADFLSYRYENHLDVLGEGPHRRAASTRIAYGHLSPKVGATYRIGLASSLFLSYRHAFRVPSENQLFRQGSTSNTLDLVPVKADNFEVGIRFNPLARVSADISAYRMNKRDDIVTYIQESGARISTNAGQTSHTGIEVGLDVRPLEELHLHGSISYAVHRYEDWEPAADADLSGNEMEVAPRILAFGSMAYSPAFWPRLSVAVDVNRLGSYWMDAENTLKYDGHTVISIRGSYDLPFGIMAFGRVANVTDALYAEQATYSRFRGEELAPGQPRAVFFGIQYQIGGEAPKR